jgi:hypothetical protein
MTKSIKTTPYLYGVEVEDFIDLKYKDALIFKYHAGKKLLGVVLKDGYMNADTTRMNAVIDAMDFNKELLKEIGIDCKF